MASSKSPIENMTAVDSASLDCGVCQCPLKPPIFQCEVGHFVCSECSEKMATAERCHVCRRALAGGYKRCYGAEHIVEGLMVPCPNKDYGCSVKLARYDVSAHLRVCQYWPFHCPAEDCKFVDGDLLPLRNHFVSVHKWPRTDVLFGTTKNLVLVDGFNVTVPCSRGCDYYGLVLLKVTRESYGRAVTAIDIRRPRNSKKCWLRLEYGDPCGTHRLQYEFNAASTDLSASGGLSFLDGCVLVPKSAQPLDMDTIKVAFTCWYLP